jgi:diguanylate cyclase (GGDEF)-like protein
MSVFPHIAILTLQALLLAGATVWLFRWRSRFGLGFFVAATVAIGAMDLKMQSLADPMHSGIMLTFGGSLLFSCKLFAVLLIYVREDAREARAILYGVFAASLVTLLISTTAISHVWMSGIGMNAYHELFKFSLLHAFGMAILIVDAYVLILVYEWCAQRSNAFLSAFAALAVALSIDNVAFYAIYSGREGFGALLAQSFLGKWYAALVYASAFALTLRWFGFDPDSRPNRRLGDVFDTLTFRQRFEELRLRAEFDGLTGLKTRAKLEHDASDALENPHMVVAMIDIDYFKRVNDEHGHLRGDVVLREVGQRIKQAIPAHAEAYRYGGEEFVVMGELSNSELENLRLAVAGQTCNGLAITVSVGAATPKELLRSADSSGTVSVRAVFELADQRLYQAKRGGRNRVVAFS